MAITWNPLTVAISSKCSIAIFHNQYSSSFIYKPYCSLPSNSKCASLLLASHYSSHTDLDWAYLEAAHNYVVIVNSADPCFFPFLYE